LPGGRAEQLPLTAHQKGKERAAAKDPAREELMEEILMTQRKEITG